MHPDTYVCTSVGTGQSAVEKSHHNEEIRDLQSLLWRKDVFRKRKMILTSQRHVTIDANRHAQLAFVRGDTEPRT